MPLVPLLNALNRVLLQHQQQQQPRCSCPAAWTLLLQTHGKQHAIQQPCCCWQLASHVRRQPACQLHAQLLAREGWVFECCSSLYCQNRAPNLHHRHTIMKHHEGKASRALCKGWPYLSLFLFVAAAIPAHRQCSFSFSSYNFVQALTSPTCAHVGVQPPPESD